VTAYNGILVVDKPAGWTSHDVVKKAKNLLGGCKVGHTGTLDPSATGVLILLVGEATKQAKRFENDTKSYLAEVTFGFATDTYDSTGTVTETGDPSTVSISELKRTVEGLRGDSLQSPPPYSAVKVSGTRLYKLARKGEMREAHPRKITIDSIEADFSSFPIVRLDISCSKGTYIRSIAHDLGRKAGCPAHLSALRRTRAGEYTISDAVDFVSAAQTADGTRLAHHIRQLPGTE